MRGYYFVLIPHLVTSTHVAWMTFYSFFAVCWTLSLFMCYSAHTLSVMSLLSLSSLYCCLSLAFHGICISLFFMMFCTSFRASPLSWGPHSYGTADTIRQYWGPWVSDQSYFLTNHHPSIIFQYSSISNPIQVSQSHISPSQHSMRFHASLRLSLQFQTNMAQYTPIRFSYQSDFVALLQLVFPLLTAVYACLPCFLTLSLSAPSRLVLEPT